MSTFSNIKKTVIGSPESPRLRGFFSQQHVEDFVVSSAVDGKRYEELGHTFDSARFKSIYGAAPKHGEIGCTLAHIQAYRNFLQSDGQADWLLVAESDARFLSGSMEQVQKILKSTSADVIVLAGSVSETRYLPLSSFEMKRTHVSLFAKYFVFNSRLYYIGRFEGDAFCAGFYAMRRSAVQKFIDWVDSLPEGPYFCADYWAEFKRELDLDIHYCRPGFARWEGESEIGYDSIQQAGTGSFSPRVAISDLKQSGRLLARKIKWVLKASLNDLKRR